MIFWPVLTIISCLWLLPKVKGAFIAAQIFLNDKKVRVDSFFKLIITKLWLNRTLYKLSLLVPQILVSFM